MPRSNEMREFDGMITHRTAAGVKYWFEDLDEEHWLPLSQIELADDGSSVLIPEWLCATKGIG